MGRTAVAEHMVLVSICIEHYVETTNLEELLVERPTSVKLSQMELHLDVFDEKFRFRAHANGGTEDLACGSDVKSSDFEGGVSSPELIRSRESVS
jgi:hypothetical protein